MSFFTDIGEKVNIGPDITPISVSYRCIPVSCHHRYRVFRRYRPRYVPDIANNITIYRHRREFSTTSFPMCMQYHNIPISAFHDIGAIYTISGPIYYLPPPPAALRLATVQALQLMRHCNDSGRIYKVQDTGPQSGGPDTRNSVEVSCITPWPI